MNSSNQPKKLILTTEIPVRWRDLDDFSHVNSTTYFTYFEEARVKVFENEVLNMKKNKSGPAVITQQCTYRKQIHYPNILTVKVYGGPPGRSSFTLFYEIYPSSDPQTVYATGKTKIVWVDYSIGKSMPLPAHILATLPVLTSE